ncbi:ABC transporter permease [Parapedobacter koreensis]|uniref:Putative ABC transport system permease protein n=1 Tax=Parapedobacter koreensis TaxID=332977 RepID=A0A1H7R250_9SPHI|nr:ABC transporter permease [Parapedobacter koreensis]SEL53984.1 putative ABC transport system permease protein [Parapedobacter koreensis]
MIKNNFKTAWRNLLNNKLFSALNIFGLAVGLGVSFLLALFIIQERAFDAFPNRDRIFRYLAHINYEGNDMLLASVPNAVGPTVKDNIPEVELSARALLNDFGDNANISVGNDAFIESRLYWADPEIVEIFDLHFIHGDRKTALNAPNAVLLSASKAKQYFGDKNPVGMAIELNRNTTLNVTGVYADLPTTSTFDAELIGAYSTTGFARRNTWDNASFETWIMLRDADDRQKVETYLPKMIEEHVEADRRYFSLALQPLEAVHLNSSEIDAYSDRKGDAAQLQQLTYLAIALLLMAAINYMNLATARAQQRGKEVGISKALGANRQGLLGKFYIETALLTWIAVVFGIVFTVLGIPVFNALSGKTLVYATLAHPVFWIGLPVFWLSLTLIAGLYPAIILSAYTPLEALQKGKAARTGSALFRRVLVVVQFSASIILIVGVIIMYLQMDFVSKRKLGYNPENVIVIGLSSAQNKQEFDALKNQIGALGQTQGMVLSQAFPGKGESGRSIHKDDADKQGAWLSSNRIIGDIQQVLQLDVLAGRMIKDRLSGDTTETGTPVVEVVLNKYAVDYLGLTPEEAIGKRVLADLGDHSTIVGVVDNFNYASLHSPVGAYAFTNASESIRYLMVRFSTGDLRETLRQYEAAYKKVLPDAPFDYTFLDSHLKSRYLADQQTAKVLLVFSILAVFIGCLGLFGLAAFTAEKRTKEIGVRKVLGATVPSLVRLLSIDFIKLVVVAFIVACPMAYWGFNKWLDNFAYRIDIQWWMFGIAGLVAIVIALVTVSSQAIKAALANPVESLRDE